jgi:SAM-dependent methyltransferase
MTKEQDAMTREWDGLAGEWDDLASVYAQSLYAHVRTCHWLEAANPIPQPPRRMVDFGCGTGLWIEQMMQQSLSDSDNSNDSGWQILALDASSSMIRVVREKMRNCEWTNVQPLTTPLAQWDTFERNDDSQDTTANSNTNSAAAASQVLSEWWGTADIVVAWNVLSFIPLCDQAATMRQVARLLKPQGIFCHSDWPDTAVATKDDHCTTANTLPIGNNTMGEERAQQLYAEGGLQAVSMELVPLVVAPRSVDPVPVFVGVARKA